MDDPRSSKDDKKEDRPDLLHESLEAERTSKDEILRRILFGEGSVSEDPIIDALAKHLPEKPPTGITFLGIAVACTITTGLILFVATIVYFTADVPLESLVQSALEQVKQMNFEKPGSVNFD